MKMGRSKFPGKPSKHVNRTRINVLCTPEDTTTVGDSNNVVTVDTDNSKKAELQTVSDQITNEAGAVARRKHTKILSKRAGIKRNGILQASKLSNQVPRRTRSAVTNRRSIRTFSTIRKVPKTKEPNNLVGKFVLPSRSVHSSRVIKPNKRFISIDSNECRTFKKRVAKRLCVRENDDKASANNVKDNNEQNVKGKVVLRQARLQLHNQSTAGPEGPFSCTSNSVSPPGTVTCGVCGAVRFYRFVKQARKFNIYSCESCRKFISKMIKRQSNSNSVSLVCHKGQGTCHVPPIVRSQQWKLFRCAYRARCPACWLKMCLRSFQMPVDLRNNLAQLLPKNMQACDVLFSNSLPLLSWQATTESNHDLPLVSKEDEAQELPIRRRPVRAIKKESKQIVPPPEIKRQKVDLKGPRVKHVCRSASIVLGQPIATFPVELKKSDVDDKDDIIKSSDKDLPPRKEIEIEKIKQDSDNTSQSCCDKLLVGVKNIAKIESVKKDRTAKSISAHSQTENKLIPYMKKNITRLNTIAIDFWENYDPDEIIRNGFGLMSSETFPMKAICFLCGSAGQETLLHCLICCEPYHPYCLDQSPNNFLDNNVKHDWLCPRCTTCNACGHADRQKINCLKCHKAYHPNCLNPMWKRDDKPTVCSNCLRCKSCGTENIKKFVGNLALCHVCFKLRNKGNYCPLCQKCYDDNDFETKMMECSKCKKWVHANCESLADEQYQILSLLPDSVEFLCHLCSSQSTPYWKDAICNELKASFNHVLRLLSKNRMARNLLKLSPYKPMTVTGRTPISVRRIQFREDDTIDINENKEPEEVLIRRQSSESQDSVDKQESKMPVSPTMVDIKNKLNSNEYISLQEFNTGMENALTGADEELLKIYHLVLKEVFPWYDPSIKNELISTPVKAPPVQINTPKRYTTYTKDDDNKVDNRMCGLCKDVGDGLPDREARLLYCGQNEWIHANCALWSSEVYEEIDGSLQNVHSALSRGRLIKCASCKQKGASVGCCEKGCHETYHFGCALKFNCYFLHDKTVYCPTHKILDTPKLLSTPSDFDIRRSVYVEIDRKKKRYCEPDKIHFMVGSLSVTNLGKIIPVLSDDADALIPLGFVCTRLFWSMTEPWKVIPYNITTSILNSQANSIYVDRNFTIDHSLPKTVIEQKFKEILSWQRDLSKDSMESELEEEQHATDLFSPEITDEIFADLPHDFLDGLSEQDMMMYDDLLNMDFKSDMNYSENIVNNDPKKEFPEEDVAPELKRSKSEVFNQLAPIEKITKNRSHQRSCSLTLSCKLDTPVIKKRKITPRDNMFFQLLQVDGSYDLSDSESASPMHKIEEQWTESETKPSNKKRKIDTIFQLLQVDGAYDSSESECGSPNNGNEEVWSFETSEEPVTCERCQSTYRTRASYTRHLENCDALSTSESDSDEHQASAENVVIASYESFSSYQTNEVSTIMNTQTMVTSEATSEVISVPENANLIYPTYHEQVLNQKTAIPGGITLNGLITQPNITVNQASGLEENISSQISNQSASSTFFLESQNLSMNHGLISLDNSSITLNQSNPISLNPITINQPVEIQQPVTIQSLPFASQDVSPLLNITPQTLAPPNLLNSVVTVPQNQLFKPIIKPVNQKAIRPRAKPRSLAAKTNRLPTGGTIIMPQTNTSAPVIVQHLPSSNMVPTFVDAFQQQTGQNLQYVATIAPQPQLVQIQPENNFLSLVNGVQPTMIIQQPRVVADQLIVDRNGSMMWATQPVQPVYYGFETIVQNTVMQSQQFLPTTMSGVLTTNSSYSATTQVFQTSKLEPVIDVGQGGFVLVNSGHNPTTIQMPLQISPHNLPATSQISMPQVQSSRIEPKVHHWNVEPQRNIEIPTSQHIQHPQIPQVKAQTSLVNQHCITLPVAPFVPEQGIPTNIVTPTLKPPTSIQCRPMSRVLPMQTNAPREQRKPIVEEKPAEKVLESIKDNTMHVYKPKITLIENVIIKEENQALKTLRMEKVEKSKIINKLDVSKNNFDLAKKDIVKNLEIHKNYVTKKFSVPLAYSPPKSVPPLDISYNTSPKQDHSKTTSLMEIPNEEDNQKSLPQTIEKDLDISSPMDITKNVNIAEIDISKHLDISNISESLNIGKSISTDVVSESILKKENVPTPATISSDLTSSSLQSIDIATKTAEKSMPLLDIADEKLQTQMESNVKPPNKPQTLEKPTNPSTNATKGGTSVLYTVETRDGFRYSSTSIYELWSKVFEAVQAARAAHNMPPLPANALDMINNLQLLGLKTNGLRYLLEQLPGASKCSKYKPAFHNRTSTDDSDDDMDIGSTSGAIRMVPYVRKKEHNDMFGWLASKHRKPESCLLDTDLLPRRGSVTNLPMAMRFRQLKLTSKLSVGVYRSGIHRRGLFSLRDIESGEMVIEYAGEVIRSILTDKREKYYNSKGIGCYMFRIDDNLVVDATMKGNAARFINHSCDPNCYSKVVEIHGHKHIIIFALRRIISGEELTYDYKFPFEEDKIPCTCGARRCRKFLN